MTCVKVIQLGANSYISLRVEKSILNPDEDHKFDGRSYPIIPATKIHPELSKTPKSRFRKGLLRMFLRTQPPESMFPTGSRGLWHLINLSAT